VSFAYRRSYRGRLRAAVLDWAGTVVDHGCLAPPATFIEAFAGFGVAVSVAQARAPMGMAKRDHIKAIIEDPDVAAAWVARYGAPAAESDVDAIYDRFLPLQVAVVEQHSALIPGALEAVQAMRARGMAIGSTTGYPRAVMAVAARAAEAQGYVPDCVVSADDTPKGRPGPFPALKALIEMAVSPVEAVVKIGDTVVDVEEGLNGGMWSVGITATGNEVGLGVEEWSALPEAERMRLVAAAGEKLLRAGAHYVCASLAEVLPILDDIDARLARGEKP
jgi:phosphonoacetaldehyde hydrolase